jgi:hypothetical protein
VRFDFSEYRAYFCWMTDMAPSPANLEAAKAELKRELQKGLASGKSKRTPEQIREDFRKAREAA